MHWTTSLLKIKCMHATYRYSRSCFCQLEIIMAIFSNTSANLWRIAIKIVYLLCWQGNVFLTIVDTDFNVVFSNNFSSRLTCDRLSNFSGVLSDSFFPDKHLSIFTPVIDALTMHYRQNAVWILHVACLTIICIRLVNMN